ncbi:MAG: extracellular solute-binding protein [Clostridiales bacterium]|nr:extracellular solute-binding protein [Clostridiales bacterium]
MKKLISLILALAMVLSLAACGGSSSTTSDDDGATSVTISDDDLDYTYGEHFYSETPVTYTMYLNDNSAYPYKDAWSEEGGIFWAIQEATNVTLDIQIVDNTDYTDKVSLAVSAGNAPYIIPKIYSETAYVTGGGVVPVSDYVQYMPNYQAFYEEYDMEDDVASLYQEDGKYYRLPGMKETCLQDYTICIRDDIFKAAGYDVSELEDDWTWDEFVDILVDVKAYMVSEGMIDESDYIWSDMWCGAQSGQGNGGNLLKLIGASYGIYSGWAMSMSSNYGLVFNTDTDEFELGSTSENYKEMMTVVQRMVDEGILDPETFTQNDDTAQNKFYRGETALLSVNRSTYTTTDAGLATGVGEGNYSLYRILVPIGTTDEQAENERLECGIMISTNALDELGEEEFIKMMRFVDWLWYSEEGQTLTKWGLEGETYTVDDNGNYSLTDGYYCAGLSIAQTSDDQVDMRVELGYACGNFMYGGTTELLTSNFDEGLRDFYDRMSEYRSLRDLDPTISLSEDELEQANLWGTPLDDTINSWTLGFAEGLYDLDEYWDQYVADVESQNVESLLDLYNTRYQESQAG